MIFQHQRQLLFIALFLSFVSCSSPLQLPRLSAGAVILAFGDSLTYGTGVAEEDSYPAVLEDLTGHEVVNAGLPGEVTQDGLKRLPGLLDEVRPELLILCHGGNDLIRKVGKDQIATNLRRMITIAQQRGVAVLLIAVPKPGMLLSPPQFYASIAEEVFIPIESEVLADVLASRVLKSDAIHPNRDGYRKMAEAVFRLMQESGAF